MDQKGKVVSKDAVLLGLRSLDTAAVMEADRAGPDGPHWELIRELMSMAADMGAHILPPIPAFYHRPATIADIIDQTVGKILDCFEIEHDLFQPWGEKRRP